jgi:hypothetical protein
MAGVADAGYSGGESPPSDIPQGFLQADLLPVFLSIHPPRCDTQQMICIR